MLLFFACFALTETAFSSFASWKYSSQYFHDSMSNVSHLPAVDQRI